MERFAELQVRGARRSRRGARGPRDRRDRWLVSYADLMTVLFALFVVLFARAQVRTGFAATKEEARPREATRSERARLLAELNEALRGEVRGKTVWLGETPEGIVVSLKEIGSFRSGEAVPLPAAAAVVGRISGVVARSGAPVRVEGHTDDRAVRVGGARSDGTPGGGSGWNSNWELSTARAEAVLGLLLERPEISPGNMSVAGYGAFRPVASNGTEEGRRANRRVDLVVMCAP